MHLHTHNPGNKNDANVASPANSVPIFMLLFYLSYIENLPDCLLFNSCMIDI